MGKKDSVTVTVKMKHETDKAYLVTDGDNEVWVPKSHGELELISGDTYELTLPEWIAEAKSLI